MRVTWRPGATRNPSDTKRTPSDRRSSPERTVVVADWRDRMTGVPEGMMGSGTGLSRGSSWAWRIAGAQKNKQAKKAEEGRITPQVYGVAEDSEPKPKGFPEPSSGEVFW